MKLAIAVLALLALSSAKPTSDDNKIVGGQTASDGQFPYQVSLRKDGYHFCGGSIINENWILTAAHCVYQTTGPVIMYAGTNSLSSGGLPYNVIDGYYHGGWDPSVMQNDIAVLKVAGPIRFNDKIRPINLNRNFVGAGAQVTLSGWGTTSYPGSPPDLLQFINLRSISTQECQSQQQTATDQQLCTFTRYGEGACHGDSGGPLAYNGEVAGIVSYGQPCAVGVPDVFTRVSAYASWVDQVINS